MQSRFTEPFSFWEPEEWIGWVFGQVPSDPMVPALLAMLFKTGDYGRKALNAISGWNDHKDTDEYNNIALSFSGRGNAYLAFV